MLPNRKIFCLVLTLISLLLTSPAYGLQPCDPDTWYANPNRSSSEWQALASWVVVAELIERIERIEPYPNCSLEDRSKCTMMDVSSVKFLITRSLKGDFSQKSVSLEKGFCAPNPPKEIGAQYKIYGGLDKGHYIFIEKVD